MNKKCLFIDRKYALDFLVNEEFSSLDFLMPSLNDSLYKINFEKSSLISTEIINLNLRLSKLVVENYYCDKSFNQYGLLNLPRAFGGILTFLLVDRLLRLNEYCKLNRDKNFETIVPKVYYKHDHTISYEYFFYNIVEQDPDFNQWLINFITNFNVVNFQRVEKNVTQIEYISKDGLHLNKVISKKSLLKKIFKENPHTGELRFSIKDFSLKLLKKIKEKAKRPKSNLSEQLKENEGNNLIWWDVIGPNSKLMLEVGDFNFPDGPLIQMREPSLYLAKYDRDLREKVFQDKFKEIFFDEFKQFFNLINETQYIPDSFLNNVSFLFWDLQPTCVIEGWKINCDNYINNFKNKGFKYYFCGGTFHNIQSSFRMFTCNHLSIEILASQHSAWGGYLANGPLVTEVLIAGCDEYVTFGWSEKPIDGSSWKNKVHCLPAPVLSDIASKSNKKTSSRKARRVLFCSGFLYRFPSIYNSSLRLDIVSIWANIINEVLEELAAENIQVEIKMYSTPMLKNMDEILKFWLKNKNSNISEYRDHSQSMRVLMGQDEFKERYDAIIWDIPAGGFTESIATSCDTFALWNDKILKYLPEGEKYIESLLKEQILFDSGKSLRLALRNYYESTEWYDQKDRRRAIDDFMNSFVRLDENWKVKWLNFFKNKLDLKSE